MTNNETIVSEIRKEVFSIAHHSPLAWFFDLHLPEVVKSSEDLLIQYPEADREVVLISACLHDLGHFRAKTLDQVDAVKPDHHLAGAEMAEELLQKYDLSDNKVQKIIRCIQRHRVTGTYIPETIEEKIVAVADTLSHFQSIFYLIYFKIYPEESLQEYVVKQKEKLERDWRDLALLPKAQDLARDKYEVITKMLEAYKPAVKE